MKILIIGGYGTFGKRLVNSLLYYRDHQIVIGGRSKEKLAKARHMIRVSMNSVIDTVELDVLNSDLVKTFAHIEPDLVVNVSGPYQLQTMQETYRVAKACLNTGCHYVDLADDRKFVGNFARQLNDEAKQNELVMVTGASTVPALTDAVITHYEPQFKSINSIYYGISPGNRTERGKGTVGSILSYTGKPFDTLINGDFRQVYGWQDLTRYDFGGSIGKRWMSNCEIPDLDLIPALYPEIKSVRFQAGLEVSLLHLGLWLLSWFPRLKLIKTWRTFTNVLVAMSEWFKSWGSDCGGMFIELGGVGDNGETKKAVWQLVAEDGVGPNVPTIAAELVVNKIANGELGAGAYPCTGLFTLEEFLILAGRWGIYQREIK
ncbi:saccharopine dehydrogenase family protein [Aliikangiella sp. G2MR2-5]|uniref:saccharopine dehydrogenase family protein n=1 Tax=Aliikangiella sp. G2MR2-5 TaxID=2788943 RepID=UPI0018ABAA16|nr:saccharopine dehydrogenase NADP-binding domain-containing protein [Aliikangiella sp. G2MR2-5]